MKKIFSILAISTLVLSGCVKFESDAPVVLDSVNAPAISVTSVGDYSIVATVTPAQNTDYYAFAVIPGPADELSGESLLSNAYKSAAVVSKVAKASDEATLTIEAKKLDPNTTYTIYAVANTAMGAVSEIAVETKKTTDETKPDWADYDTEVDTTSMIFYVQFDDPVELTGKGHVFANFFGVNDTPKPSGEFEPVFSLEIPTDSLSIDEDGWVVIPVPQAFAIPGAVVAISYTDGIVKNAVGGENVAWDDIEAYVDDEGEFALDDYVIWEAYDNVNWEFVLGGVSEEDYSYSEYPEDTLVVFSDWSSFSFAIAPADEETIVAGEGDIEVVFTEGSGRKVSYTASDLYTFAQMQQYFGINATWAWIEEAPVFGATVSVKVAEGEYQDIWGNENAEFEAKDFALMSYGYELEDITGTYNLFAIEYSEGPIGGTILKNIIVAPYDDPEEPDYNVCIYGLDPVANVFFPPTAVTLLGSKPVPGYFDLDCGTVDFEPSIIGIYGGKYYVALQTYDGETLHFAVPQKGILDFSDEPLEIAAYSPDFSYAGWLEVVLGYLEKVSDDCEIPEPEVAPTAVRPSFTIPAHKSFPFAK
ncbi:MAG: hypothetical protein MJY41_02780 [Bacteroidales bacterium]|nr:hypothetical protein [Bacteroidales bacterium]